MQQPQQPAPYTSAPMTSSAPFAAVPAAQPQPVPSQQPQQAAVDPNIAAWQAWQANQATQQQQQQQQQTPPPAQPYTPWAPQQPQQAAAVPSSAAPWAAAAAAPAAVAGSTPAWPGYAPTSGPPPAAASTPAAAPTSYGAPVAVPGAPRVWVGTVTQLIPPNYGIVDHDAFYVEQLVVGRPPQVGERVRCDAIPNTDGGKYAWRITRLQAEAEVAAAAAAAAQEQQKAMAPGLSISAPKSAKPVVEPSKKEKFNAAPPPTIAYTADVAMAVAANAADRAKQEAANAAATAAAASGKMLSRPAPKLSKEELQKAESAVQPYSQQFGIGATLLSKMGFGAMQGSKGGLGAKEQGIAAPVDPLSTKGQMGLGFSAPPPRSRGGGSSYAERELRRRGSYDRGRDRGRASRRSRSRSPSSSASRSRSRSSTSRSSSASSSRSRSPSPVKRVRYRCAVPKFPAGSEPVRGLASISKRYKHLYIPSDFCNLSCSWASCQPGSAPLEITHPIAFNILPEEKPSKSDKSDRDKEGKDKEGKDKEESKGEDKDRDGKDKESKDKEGNEETKATAHAAPTHPSALGLSDAEIADGKTWSVRVVVYSGVSPEVLYSEDAKSFQHPHRGINFLVGKRVRERERDRDSSSKEVFLPGGAWSPQDGGHPAHDPTALIATCVRTVKEATGMDLSGCNQWLRLAELSYLRSTSGSSGGSAVARTPANKERCVVFLADAWSVAVPNTPAYDAVEKAQAAQGEEGAAAEALRAAEAAHEAAELRASQASSAANVPMVDPATGNDLRLDPNKLNVAQLQEELGKRQLDVKWDPLKGKKQLVDRLQAHLDERRTQQAEFDDVARRMQEAQKEVAVAKENLSAAKSKLSSSASAARQGRRVMRTPLVPQCITVPRSNMAAMALEKLLDYTESDISKEPHFEVCLVAELFSELLCARFGQAVLRALPLIAKEGGDGKERDERRSTRDGGRDKERERDTRGSGRDRDRERERERGKEGRDRERERDSEGDKAQKEAKEGDKDRGSKEGGKEEAKAGKEEGGEKAQREGEGDVAMGEAKDGEKGQKSPLGSGKRAATDGEQGAEGSAAKRAKTSAEGDTEATEPGMQQGPSEPLLLACRYFDTECAGYLETDDLEEILYMTNSDVSRE